MHCCLSHSAVTSLLANSSEWALATGDGGGLSSARQLMLRHLSAAEGLSAQSEVTNSLGVDCQMIVNLAGGAQELVELPADGGVGLLTQPLQQPPPGMLLAEAGGGGSGGGRLPRGAASSSAGGGRGEAGPAAPPLWVLVDVLAASSSLAAGGGSLRGGEAASLSPGDEVQCAIKV